MMASNFKGHEQRVASTCVCDEGTQQRAELQ